MICGNIQLGLFTHFNDYYPGELTAMKILIRIYEVLVSKTISFFIVVFAVKTFNLSK
jgi:hypothetical protein